MKICFPSYCNRQNIQTLDAGDVGGTGVLLLLLLIIIIIIIIIMRDLTDWSRSNALEIYSEGSVRISVGTQTMATDILRGFPRCLHTNSGIVQRLWDGRFLPSSFEFINHSIPFDVM
jgi:hypothetical protein